MEPELSYEVYETSQNSWRVRFEYEGPESYAWKGRLSVSRIPNHAFYYPNKIAEHNGQGPHFASPELAMLLVDRVTSDFKYLKDGKDPSTSPELVSRGPVASKPYEPEPDEEEEEFKWDDDEEH